MIVPATKEMLATIGEVRPSVKALAVVEDGKVLGIVGVYPDRNGVQWMFMSLTEEIKQKPRSIIEGWKKARQWIDSTTMPTRAFCDDSIQSAEQFLLHFGFVELEGRVFEWRSQY